MSGDECARCAELEQRVEELEDFVDSVAEDVFANEATIDDLDDAVAAQKATVESHATRLADLESRLASVGTERADREEALKDALIRQAVSRGGPVAKWWRELKDLAASLDGVDSDYKQPVWDRHIESLQDEPGFKKTAILAEMENRDERREVKAIAVNPEQVPPGDRQKAHNELFAESPVEDNANGVVGDDGSGASESTAETAVNQSHD